MFVKIICQLIINFYYFVSYAPWCPACKSLEPEWKEFAKWSEQYSKVSVASTDITISPGLTGRFVVTSLPTIFQ